jgi:hypothetical protein
VIINNDGSLNADSIGINATNSCVEHPVTKDGDIDLSKVTPTVTPTTETKTTDVNNMSIFDKYDRLSGGDKAIIICVLIFFLLMFLLLVGLLIKKK